MDYIIISIVAFAVAILTFFSGFGLGTIMTPVFMVFFPADLAIALTGVVHFLNNIFKVILVGKNADWTVVLRFGLPAIIAAFIGAWILLQMTTSSPLFSYTLWGHTFLVFPIKLMVALLLIIFATIEIIPATKKLKFSPNKLLVGGALSGFFGGLSGNQGALRSAFLVKLGLTKEAFIGTTVVVSTLVDCTRLSVYSTKFLNSGLMDNIPLILCATSAGIMGWFLGNNLLKKVTIDSIQTFVAALLLLLAISLGMGLI